MKFILACLCSLTLIISAPAQDAIKIEIDFAKTNGQFHALHGINKGPLTTGGLIDLSEAHRALKLPLVRLHDCHWPNPDVVDMHVVFPNLQADTQNPQSYDFRLTDEYLAKVHATGAPMLYRLGESIEHTSVKRWVHPPADYQKWAEASLGIIRHYNEGWANGFHYNIRYWEIWNEPENRPAMWSGSDEDYFRLYATTARVIKAQFPNLKIGGPAVGYSGKLEGDKFVASDFVKKFLQFCRNEKLPLHFFSWHCYTDNPAELTLRAKGIRQLLNDYGFTQTESHLNEWNYLPGNTWEPISGNAAPLARQKFYEEMAGVKGAAFIVTSLLQMQDAPLDAANFFHGELGGFGLFNEHGVPMKSYYAFQAFSELLQTPQRVGANGTFKDDLSIAAGVNAPKSQATVLISSFNHLPSKLHLKFKNLPWQDATDYEIKLVDANHNLEALQPPARLGESLNLNLPAPGITLVHLRPKE
jgi:hypothetical protein